MITSPRLNPALLASGVLVVVVSGCSSSSGGSAPQSTQTASSHAESSRAETLEALGLQLGCGTDLLPHSSSFGFHGAVCEGPDGGEVYMYPPLTGAELAEVRSYVSGLGPVGEASVLGPTWWVATADDAAAHNAVMAGGEQLTTT